MLQKIIFFTIDLEINYTELNNYFLISIIEIDLIENIFINNNVWIKDDLLIENLNSKVNSFLTKKILRMISK